VSTGDDWIKDKEPAEKAEENGPKGRTTQN
jgi:hypothetical protein